MKSSFPASALALRKGPVSVLLMGKSGSGSPVGGHVADVAVVQSPRRAAGKGAGDTRPVVAGGNQGLAIDVVGRRFRAGQERRSHLHAIRAKRQRGGDAAPIGDTARRDHRNAQRIDNLRHQGEGADASGFRGRFEGAAMTAGFEPLGNDGVDTGGFKVFRLGDGRRRTQNHRAGVLDGPHHAGIRQSEMETDDRR